MRLGDRDAAEQLARRYLPAARTVALAVVGKLDTAEDVCQDAFVYAIGRIEECRHPERFGGWLLTIVRNRGRNRVRALRTARVVSGDVQCEDPRAGTPEHHAEHTQARDRLLVALSRLPEVRCSVLLLHDLEGWTHKEIAALLQLPSGTIRSHLHFARKAVRSMLEDYYYRAVNE